MSGPADVNNSLPILKAPAPGANAPAKARASSADGTSNAAVIGFCMAGRMANRRPRVKINRARPPVRRGSTPDRYGRKHAGWRMHAEPRHHSLVFSVIGIQKYPGENGSKPEG